MTRKSSYMSHKHMYVGVSPSTYTHSEEGS